MTQWSIIANGYGKAVTYGEKNLGNVLEGGYKAPASDDSSVAANSSQSHKFFRSLQNGGTTTGEKYSNNATTIRHASGTALENGHSGVTILALPFVSE